MTNSVFVTAQSEFITNLQRQQSYYDSLVTVMGVDSMQGTGYTQYKRWYRYWIPKLNSNYEVKDIKVKNRKVYVGTYGRGVWFASAPSCGNPSGTYTIDSQNNVLYIGTHRESYTNVIVPTGITYIINGTLSMGADCKIIVERGAKLVVDGGTITKACPDLWGGIDVWGTSDALQTETDQGWVTLKNATIEYSRDGISTIRDVHGINLSYTGGVIHADSTTFLNNSRSVAMYRYPYEDRTLTGNNESYFKNCTFTYDSSYYYLDDSPRQHVNLSEVRGVLFESNVFENTVSPSFAYADNRGVGLLSNNSGYFLLKYENATHGNIFEGLNYGIRSLAFYQTNRPIVVDQNEFNHNKTGAYFSAETFLSITNNEFDASYFYEILTGDLYTGLYLDNCTGYQVEENEFYSDYFRGLPYQYKSLGTYINNSGSEDNFIYNNNFNKLLFATVAQNHNRSDKHEQTGLQYKCNDFTDNYSDIAVTWDGLESNFNGIAEHQGSADTSIIAPAGNFFSHNESGADSSDFNNTGGYIYYHLPNWNIVSNYLYKWLKPIYYTKSTIKLEYNNAITIWDTIQGCPSNLNGKTKDDLKILISSLNTNEETFQDSLSIKVDDGNTTALNLDVATSLPPETMELRDDLLASSPYLSDTVMVSAVEKEDVLPNAIITEVLTANPQSARANNVLSALNERVIPPSASQMEEIHSNDTIIGKKEILESKRAFFASKKQNATNTLVRLYMNDSVGIGIYDSIASALENIETLASYYQQAFCKYNKGDTTAVETKLAEITTVFYLTDYENNLHNKFEDFFDVLISLQTQNKIIIQIDSVERALIEVIMNNSNDKLSAYCRNILIATTELEYHEPYLFPDTSLVKSASITQYSNGEELFTDKNNLLNIYPNPANKYLVIEYNLPNKPSSAIATIANTSGIVIETIKLDPSKSQKILDLRKYTTGTYLISIISSAKVLETKKFVKY